MSAGVCHDVSSSWPVRVAEESCRIRLNLVCHNYSYVVGFRQSYKLMQILVQFLLAFREVFPSDVFSSEVADHAVDDNEFDVAFWAECEESVD